MLSEKTFNQARQSSIKSFTPAWSGVLQRKCACGGSSTTGQCAECNKKEMTLQRRSAGQHEPETVPPIVYDVLRSPGQPLDTETRSFFEPRFGHDFSRVRVHTDGKAAESAQAVNALAYTAGRDVVFGAGQYAPHSASGRGLVAHELMHVVQQENGSVSVQLLPGDMHLSEPGDPLERQATHMEASLMSDSWRHVNAGRVLASDPTVHESVQPQESEAGTSAGPMLMRRQDVPTGTGMTTDDRGNDPNFLMCLALCELGIPPNLWRTVVNKILSAVSQEYRDRLGDLRGSQEFERFRAEFTVMSTFNKLKLVIGFLGESRIGLLTIERPAAQAIRRALLARLAARGLESATLEVVSQILRKVAIAIEVAVAAGCMTYCSGMAIANALLDFSSAVIGAISSFINVASQLGADIRQAIARPILVARASMDPANWNLTALPMRSRAHMQAIGLSFRLAFSPDSFLASMARPLSSYNIPQILAELAQDINTTLQARGGFVQLVTFTADFIGSLTPLQLVDILKDYRLLSFLQDPGVLVDQQQAQQAATPP